MHDDRYWWSGNYFIYIICRPTPSIAIPRTDAHNIREWCGWLMVRTGSVTVATFMGTISVCRAVATSHGSLISIPYTASASAFISASIAADSAMKASSTSASAVVAVFLILEAHHFHVRLHRCKHVHHGCFLGVGDRKGELFLMCLVMNSRGMIARGGLGSMW